MILFFLVFLIWKSVKRKTPNYQSRKTLSQAYHLVKLKKYYCKGVKRFFDLFMKRII